MLRIGGIDCAHRVYRPSAAPSDRALPLVVFLHGGFGDCAAAERYHGWDALADARQVVVAYPDGLARAWNVGGDCCGEP